MKYGEIIEKLTLEEKISLTSGKNFWQTQNIERDGADLIPSIFLSDGPHGIRKQIAAADHLGLNESLKATCLPTASAMACSWDEELAGKAGQMLGEEAKAQKVNVLLGPGTNIKRNPLCGRNFEYFSEDPLLSGKMAAAYIRGIQKSGVAACVKHFALNNQETRRMVMDTVADERTVREIYLKPFEIAVKEGSVKAVMSSYNLVSGVYSSENIRFQRDILRGEWGYNGVVITDWNGGNDRVAALVAGSELEMPRCIYSNEDLLKAFTDSCEIDASKEHKERIESSLVGGKLNEKLLDEALDRLLDLVYSTTSALQAGPGEELGNETTNNEHNDFACRAAEESIVLLKNDESVLPLSSGAKVAIIGDFAKVPRYQGAGSSAVNPTRLPSALELLGFKIKKDKKSDQPSAKDRVVSPPLENEYGLNVVGFSRGFDRYGKKNKKLLKEAIRLAEKADIAICFIGLDEISEAEGLDRKDMRLSAVQGELISALKALGKKVVAVLACGAPVELPFEKDLDALVLSHLSGQAGAKAVLNILTGRVNPSGKLAETYPVKYSDCPTYNYFPGKVNGINYIESIFVGYRYYAGCEDKVKYPFGFGVSYTFFTYSDLNVVELGVSFKITNAGKVDGKEIAQLYIGLSGSSIFRPKRELKGFKKVFIKAGMTAEVRIDFSDDAFSYFNVSSGRWEIESGVYSIEIGASCSDIRLKGEIKRSVADGPNPYEQAKLSSYYSGSIQSVSIDEFNALLSSGKDELKRTPAKDEQKFYKKNRLVIDENSTVYDMRYSKRWVGRFMSRALLLAVKVYAAFAGKASRKTIVCGLAEMPIRGLAQSGSMNRAKMEGLILICNGHFFKGLKGLMSSNKKKNKKAVK